MAINQAAITSLYDAAAFSQEFQIAYKQLKQIQAKIARYQAASDPIYNAAINAAIPAPTRVQIGAMKPEIDALLLEWETNYSDIISPTE